MLGNVCFGKGSFVSVPSTRARTGAVTCHRGVTERWAFGALDALGVTATTWCWEGRGLNCRHGRPAVPVQGARRGQGWQVSRALLLSEFCLPFISAYRGDAQLPGPQSTQDGRGGALEGE